MPLAKLRLRSGISAARQGVKMTGMMVSDQAGAEGDAVVGLAEVAGAGQAGAGQVGVVEVVHLL